MMANLGNSGHERDRLALASIGKLRRTLLCPVSGDGCYLINEDGRRILDLSASGGPAILGYGHPRTIEAVCRATKSMSGTGALLYPNEEATRLAERLIGTLPNSDGLRVWFGHSGSDATDTAVRVLSAATGRDRFISFVGSYHGGISGSMAVSGLAFSGHNLPRSGLTLIPYPDSYRGEFPAEQILDLLNYHLRTSTPGKTVAGLFMEPIISDGGVLIPPKGFVKSVEEICRSYGIMLVIDEVKVGLGRTGMMHSFEHDDVCPDFVIFGKGLGGGLPISALVGPSELMNFQSTFAVQTMSGNPIAAASANAVLDALENDNLIARASVAGDKLMSKLRLLQEKHEIIGDIRGRGLVVGIDLVKNRKSREPVGKSIVAEIVCRAFELGASFIYNGMHRNVLELTPPLIITDAEIEEGISIIDSAIRDVIEKRAVEPILSSY